MRAGRLTPVVTIFIFRRKATPPPRAGRRSLRKKDSPAEEAEEASLHEVIDLDDSSKTSREDEVETPVPPPETNGKVEKKGRRSLRKKEADEEEKTEEVDKEEKVAKDSSDSESVEVRLKTFSTDIFVFFHFILIKIDDVNGKWIICRAKHLNRGCK